MPCLWILGEAKSGKSELAEEIFARLPGVKLYIGTLPRTPENLATIEKHAERRPDDWHLVEVSTSLTPACDWLRARAGEVCVLLDGWGVYAGARACRWLAGHDTPIEAGLEAFADEVVAEYRRLAEAAAYLIVVAHVAARFPASDELAEDPARALVRAATYRCMSQAEEVIYHDAASVSHEDEEFVEAMAARLRGLHGTTSAAR
ncbi:MAG: bifunctional adenosylcobinamide kinase/adenosylcobinamide-phosphate guanylyltransferase [Armatimonadetes bacterium]|nr:bifunctional adenosylcobinamide kinase/adenosylcobinamide-phosphate guanylyltransferase [Armatimonadota bacterium]